MKWNQSIMTALLATTVSWSAAAQSPAQIARNAKVQSSATTSHARTDFKTAVAPLLDKYCTDCHGGEKPKSDLSLEFTGAREVEQRLLKDHQLFEHMAERIRLGEMPPKKKIQPKEA